jgi:phage tail-like protein
MADYPIVGFHFRVSLPGGGVDLNFQSVSGLNVQLQMETLKEGGENLFEHALPVRSKYSDLVLKRGIVTKGASKLTQWFQNAFENFEFKPWNFVVELLGEDHNPLITWKISHAIPKDWKVNDLNAERGEVLIESMTLSYSFFVRGDPKPS